MCGILDANVVHEVFGNPQSEAGKDFYQWIRNGKQRLVVGGKLWEELKRNSRFRMWAAETRPYGFIRHINKNHIDAEADKLDGRCRSNDVHVIALAQVSGARLLYSEDRDLHADFKTKALLDKPPGKVYPRGESKKKERKKLLTQKLCTGGECS